MTDEIRPNWYMPDALEKQQKDILAGKISCDNKVDFVSYNQLNKGCNSSNIESHNAVGIRAKHYAKCLHKISSKYLISSNNIADIGCGAGFIANEVSACFPKATLTGYDLSIDAIEYGNANFNHINFVNKLINTNTSLGSTFDLIYSREFYPFTRTNDFCFQKSILEVLTNVLNEHGILILSVTNAAPGIMENLEQLKGVYKNIVLEVEPSLLILKYVKNFKLAQMITFVLKKLLKKNISYFLIISPERVILQ